MLGLLPEALLLRRGVLLELLHLLLLFIRGFGDFGKELVELDLAVQEHLIVVEQGSVPVIDELTA